MRTHPWSLSVIVLLDAQQTVNSRGVDIDRVMVAFILTMEIVKQSVQQIFIKFLVKLQKDSQKINEMFNTVYKDNALKKTSIFKWIERLNESRED